MHDRRRCSALRQLDDVSRPPRPPRWRWAIADIDARGRITLPPAARQTLRLGADSPTTVDGRIHRGSLQLSACDSADGEAAVAVDARARVTLPVGLRRAALVAGGVLVGTRRSSAVVVVTTISGLDWLGDALVAAR